MFGFRNGIFRGKIHDFQKIIWAKIHSQTNLVLTFNLDNLDRFHGFHKKRGQILRDFSMPPPNFFPKKRIFEFLGCKFFILRDIIVFGVTLLFKKNNHVNKIAWLH